jgi:hypothetical protein
MDTLTPGTVELKFHGADDVKRIRLRKFGYPGENLEIKSSDEKVKVALGKPAFFATDDAKLELKQLNAGLESEFAKTISSDPQSFRCAPFELKHVRVVDNEGDLTLAVVIILDRSFGGAAFRRASQVGTSDEGSKNMARVALDGGIADVIARVHRIAAKFPAVKSIEIVGVYLATEAFTDTKTTLQTTTIMLLELRPVSVYNYSTQRWENRSVLSPTPHTYTHEHEMAVEEERFVGKVLTFVVPVAQIPDTLDKKVVGDAVLAQGMFSLSERK